MSEAVTAALISAGIAGGVALLIALGSGVRYIVSLILDAYKAQAEATDTARLADLASKDAEIDRLRNEVISGLSGIRSELGELRQDLHRDGWS